MGGKMGAQADDLCFAPIHELAPRIREGLLKPSVLVEAHLARIRALDPKLHAFLEVYEEEALATARAHDRLIAAGQWLGPLHGIPIGLKDLVEIEGRRTTGGSSPWRERVSSETAHIVHLLRRAGMVTIGKLHMVELAYGSYGTNHHMGTPHNPWDMAVPRTPGGSSSGSGVAVAAGLVPVAIGTDTGGSVRIPASLCGTVGLKTTFGAIGRTGTLYLAPTLDTIGPLTRSVHDAALVFQALQGPDAGDPATLGVAPVDPLAGLDAGIKGLRLAALPEAERAELDPEVGSAYEDALAVLARLGARIEEARLPAPLAEVAAPTGSIISAESYAIHKGRIDDDALAFDPHVRARILAGRAIPAADYIHILEERRAQIGRFAGALADVAALAIPTTIRPAVPVASIDESESPMSRITRSANYLYQCAVALPAGFTRGGLPLSLQIVAPRHREDMALRIARSYERATSWHEVRPRVA
jgi:aspartyl-tRNA(Asn)/glutamyl-tRNA(Gln) amidotransferase subunit A